MFNIGIIGCGKISGTHVDALLKMDDVQVRAVCDIDETNRNTIAKKAGAIGYKDYEEMLSNEELDLVMITLPPALHAECACKCAESGVNVFVEKPMAVSSEECKRIISACNENHVKLWVGHMQRYAGWIKLAKKAIDSGEYGKVIAINEIRNTLYPAANSPKWIMNKDFAGGGIMYNLGAHTVDMACFLGNSRVESAVATFAKEDNSVEDAAFGMLKLKNGVGVTFQLSGKTASSRGEIIVYLTDGEIRITPWEKVIACGKDGKFKQIVDPDISCETPWQSTQLADIVTTLKNGGDPEVSGEYGLNVIEAYEQMNFSVNN